MSNEQHLTLALVARLAHRYGAASKVAREMPGWLEYLTEIEYPERPRNRSVATWWNDMRKLVHSLVPDTRSAEGDAISSNIAMLGQHFGLSVIEVKILSFLSFYRLLEAFEHVVDEAISTKEVSLRLLLAQYCEVDEDAVRAALRVDGRLRASGLLQWERRGARAQVPFAISERLCSAMLAEVEDMDGLISLVFPTSPAPDAEWQDFEGLGKDADLVRAIVTSALKERTRGVNILLYGPPGTGKTEFCKVLARELGAHLRAIGETDDDGQEPSRRERLEELGLAGRMLGRRHDTLLLFDEMEDLFESSPFLGSNGHSKVHTNRLLECNPVPTFWTTNSVRNCDPAFLRRMTFSVAMRAPAGRIRERIWERLEHRHNPGIDRNALPRLANVHTQPPAQVSDAMRVAQLCGGGTEVLIQVLGAAARLTNGGVDPAPCYHTAAQWQPDLACADADLERLEARLSGPGGLRRVSFCLEGPAGTGKSAWARHLASVMGLSVHEKRASDLISKWVGESERNIAHAFAEARAEGAMLIFDEADSLISDRRGASQTWEVSQTNEMLTWMENHPLPFICTTNLAERLDPASQRRFTFRVRFDWLTPLQLPRAWDAFFEGDAPSKLLALDRLTPGDFANVSRRMRVLGEEDPAAILLELAREVEGKDGPARPIGFAR